MIYTAKTYPHQPGCKLEEREDGLYSIHANGTVECLFRVEGYLELIGHKVPKPKPVPKPTVIKEIVEDEPKKKFTKKELSSMKMNELREIGSSMDLTDNKKSDLIEKILETQGE